MIEPGKYVARAVQGDLTTKGSRGTPVVVVVFHTERGETVQWDGWLTEAAADRTLEALRHCGWVGDDVRSLEGIDANDVEVVVEHQDYNGKIFARVKWVNALGRRAAALAPDTAAAIAAGLKGKAIASRQKAGQGRPAAVRPASRPVAPPEQVGSPRESFDDMDDADLPF